LPEQKVPLLPEQKVPLGPVLKVPGKITNQNYK
ncbi:hypothetical protein SAMN05192569_105324, partial [Parageobacillus thermantarcticus]